MFPNMMEVKIGVQQDSQEKKNEGPLKNLITLWNLARVKSFSSLHGDVAFFLLQHLLKRR